MYLVNKRKIFKLYVSFALINETPCIKITTTHIRSNERSNKLKPLSIKHPVTSLRTTMRKHISWITEENALPALVCVSRLCTWLIQSNFLIYPNLVSNQISENSVSTVYKYFLISSKFLQNFINRLLTIDKCNCYIVLFFN